MNEELNYSILENILAPQTQALQQIAMRPQKSYAKTTTTPYALQDLIATRGNIGLSTKTLNDALKAREDAGYTIANALMAMPEQQGYGSWLGNAARVFGTGLATPTNAQVDRAQKIHEAEMADLANRLAFDKAMGDTKVETIGYTEMPYSAKGATVATGTDQVVKNIATATGEGMDPEEFIKEFNTGGFFESGAGNVDAQDNPTLAARFIRSAIAPINTGARSALSQNMTDKIIGPKIQNMIQNMGGARGADTLREVSTRIGPLAQIGSLGTQEQLGAISSAKSDVLDIINRDRVAGGLRPLTMEQFQPEWNKLFTGIATYKKEYGAKYFNKKEKEPASDGATTKKYDYSAYGF